MARRLSGRIHPIVAEQVNNFSVLKETKIVSACLQTSTIGVLLEKATPDYDL
jgi:hypothetical protein